MANTASILLLFVSLMIAQSVSTFPKRSYQYKYSTDAEAADLSERNKLYNYALEGVIVTSETILAESVTFLKNILTDSLLSKVTDASVEPHLQRFDDFIRKVKRFEDNHSEADDIERMHFVKEFFQLIMRYNVRNKAETTLDIAYIIIIFVKYKLDSIGETFIKRISKFIQKFDIKYEHYIDSLSEWDRRSEEAMMRWHINFVNIAKVEDKLEDFINFFDLYQEEAEENANEAGRKKNKVE